MVVQVAGQHASGTLLHITALALVVTAETWAAAAHTYTPCLSTSLLHQVNGHALLLLLLFGRH